jgi:autophagy-related protein 18
MISGILFNLRKSNMKLLHTLDTNPNPNAICALSPSSENCFLAYPSNSSGSAGEVLLYDATHLQPISIIQAHKSLLSIVMFNFDGSMIATASDKVAKKINRIGNCY